MITLGENICTILPIHSSKVIQESVMQPIDEEIRRRKEDNFVRTKSIIQILSIMIHVIISWSSFLCLFYLVQGSSSTSLVGNLHRSSGSRWGMDSRYGRDRYERERDDLEPFDEEIPPPHDFDSRSEMHFKRYPTVSRRMLYSPRRERRQPHKYSVQDFDEEFIPKRSKYLRREDEQEDYGRQFPRHRHHDDDDYQEPELLPRTYREPSHSDFDDSEASAMK